MKIIGWITGGLAVLVLLAVGAVWLVPPMLDWSHYRDQIANLAAAQLGRDVHINGPVALSLLPEPILTASRVTVVQGADGIRLDVNALRLRVALGPLLAGHIQARDLVMRGFDMTVPWPMDTSADTMRAPTWLSELSARIEEGRLAIGGLVFSDINASLSTGSLTGSYQAAGTATLSGRPWHFTARLTQPGSDGSAALDATLDGQGPVQGVGLALNGQIGGDGTLGGRISVRGPDLAQLLPAPHVAFHAEGRVTVAAGLAAADDLNVEIGGSPAHGAVALRLVPSLRLDLALTASRLNLDAWFPALLGGGPSALTVGIDLSTEAADLGGGILRRVRGAFDVYGSSVDVRELTAVLPGDADLGLAGQIERPDGVHPSFSGEAHVSAPSLRTTLDWLARSGVVPAFALPAGVLRTGDLTGFATIDSSGISVVGLSGLLDGQDLVGSLAAKVGARLALTASLQMPHLDLDPWLPAQIPAPATLSGRFRTVDVDLRLDAAEARAGGHVIAPLTVEASADGGRVTLRRLDLGVAGAVLTASGTVIEGGRMADGRLDLRAESAASIVDLLTGPIGRLAKRAPNFLRAPMRLQMSAAGPSDALALGVVADLGDLRLEARPTIDLGQGRWSGSVALHHPGASRLAESLGLAGAPAWLGDGSLAVLASLSGGPEKLTADSFDLTAGVLHAAGQIGVDASAARPVVTGRIGAETIPLPFPYLRSPDPLNLTALSGWDGAINLTAGKVLLDDSPALETLAAAVVLKDGVLRLDGVTARLGGGALSGGVRLDTHQDPPSIVVDAGATGVGVTGPLFDMALDLVAGTLDFSATVSASGYAPATLLATLSGDVRASVRDGVARGFDLDRLHGDLSDEAVAAALAGGKTPFDTLRLDLHSDDGNVAIGDARMTGPDGDAVLTGTVDLPGEAANLRLDLRPAMPDPPDLGLRLSGDLDSLQRTTERAGLLKWRLNHGNVARVGDAPARPN